MSIPYSFRILFFSVALFLAGCQNETAPEVKVDLAGTWRLNSAEPLDKRSTDLLSEDSVSANVISFFPDGSYTQFIDSGSMDFGRWTLSKDRTNLALTNGAKSSKYYPATLTLNNYRKQTLVLENKDLNKKLTFIKEHEPLPNFRNDPLYLENNKWRLKPQAALTDQELQEKISNYIKHYALILNAASERHQQVVSFEFSQGPVRIYNGAVGIYPFGIVPAHWKYYFTNEDEALKGYQIYQSAIEKGNYRRASSGNWVEDDYHILSSIYNSIASKK